MVHRTRGRRRFRLAGTDWIEDIVLRQSGTEVYDGWVAGTTPWTDPAIKSAWEEFGTAVENAYGGSDYVNGPHFGKSVVPLFSDPAGLPLPPSGELHHDVLRIGGGRQRPTSTTSSPSPISTRPTLA